MCNARLSLRINNVLARRQRPFAVSTAMKPCWSSRLTRTSRQYQRYLFRTKSTLATQPFDGLVLLNWVDTWPYYQQNPSAYKAWMADYYYFMIQAWIINHSERLLTMNLAKSFHDRTQIMHATLSQAVKEGAPTSPQKFYNESLRLVSATGEHVLDLNRSGLDPFGVVSFSAHMIGYVMSGDETRYWVPKRSASKETVPNRLDSTVAGVIRSGETPLDCMVRKIAVEASIPKEYIEDHIRSCGTVSYQMTSTSRGLPGCQHIISHLYEMEFSPDVVLVPDDEVENFTLMTLDEVKMALMEGEFVANRAVVRLAYFIRHGIMTPENEPNFVQICERLHRKHDSFILP